MHENEPTIEILRKDGVLISVKAILPTWSKTMSDGSIQISVPHIGGATTFVDSETELDQAFDDVFKAFCIMVEKHGKGLERELELIGWKSFKKHKANQSLLSMQTKQSLDNFILSTGDTRLLQLSV